MHFIRLLLLFLVFSVIFIVFTSMRIHSTPEMHEVRRESSTRRIYISMGVCLSRNAQKKTQKEILFHNHTNKPYDLASILSTALWKEQLESVNIIVVVSVPNLSLYELSISSFRKRIEAAGGMIKVFSTDSFKDTNTACIRAAQLSRSFLYEFVSNLSEDDIIVTSDVDAFPIKAKEILAPLRGIPDKYLIWISNYEYARRNRQTIPMSFVGMQVKQWRDIWATTGNMTFRDAVKLSMLDSPYYAVSCIL
jgi:hypothetical protein